MAITITVLEDIYYGAENFTTLCQAHVVDLEIRDEHFASGDWLLEIAVTGRDADVFVQLYEAIFN